MISRKSGTFCRSAFPLIAIMLAVQVPTPAGASELAPIRFENVTEDVGLADYFVDYRLWHGGAWGDITGNGLPDLYVGAFADRDFYDNLDAPMPNMLLLNTPEGFVLSPDEQVHWDTRGLPRGERARISMALFADLNDNHKLDLLLGTHGNSPESRLYENRWPDDFLNVTPTSGGWPAEFDMRNATAIDLDRDGTLDLIFVDGRYAHRPGPPHPLLALGNQGEFQFEDVTEQFGLPTTDTVGLGLAIGDVNNNGYLDMFVPHSNRLFVTNDQGHYSESQPDLFDDIDLNYWGCGAAFADLTGNDRLDMVVTVHGIPAQVFLFVNRGNDEQGMPIFENVTEASGLGIEFPEKGAALPWIDENADDSERYMDLRGAHLALVDIDNDGRRDVMLSMIHLNDQGEAQPVVFRNMGVDENGVPVFEGPPTESLLGFAATAPVADYDRDGRMDMFFLNWHAPLGSHLFRNVTEGGNYLSVTVEGIADDLNSMGIGATVRLYELGHLGDLDYLIGREDIVLGQGYSSGDEARAHFGLGDIEFFDMSVTWQDYMVSLFNVEANQHMHIPVPEPGTAVLLAAGSLMLLIRRRNDVSCRRG